MTAELKAHGLLIRRAYATEKMFFKPLKYLQIEMDCSFKSTAEDIALGEGLDRWLGRRTL